MGKTLHKLGITAAVALAASTTWIAVNTPFSAQSEHDADIAACKGLSDLPFNYFSRHRECQQALRDQLNLRDPNGSVFRGLFLSRAESLGGSEIALCGYLNARNGYGGYIGETAFVSKNSGAVTIYSDAMRSAQESAKTETDKVAAEYQTKRDFITIQNGACSDPLPDNAIDLARGYWSHNVDVAKSWFKNFTSPPLGATQPAAAAEQKPSSAERELADVRSQYEQAESKLQNAERDLATARAQQQASEQVRKEAEERLAQSLKQAAENEVLLQHARQRIAALEADFNEAKLEHVLTAVKMRLQAARQSDSDEVAPLEQMEFAINDILAGRTKPQPQAVPNRR